MSTRVVVAGTDTNIGKTVFAAALTQALDGYYWKPVQAGLEGETDSQVVRRLSGLKASRILLETYRLRTAASPHVAAELDDIQIEPAHLRPHQLPAPLVIELAGGLDVPLRSAVAGPRQPGNLRCLWHRLSRIRRPSPAD